MMKFEMNTLHKDSSLEIIGKQKHEFANIIAMWNEDILKQAEQRKENNEREDKQTYDSFSDEEIRFCCKVF